MDENPNNGGAPGVEEGKDQPEAPPDGSVTGAGGAAQDLPEAGQNDQAAGEDTGEVKAEPEQAPQDEPQPVGA